jgi:hypothetical protein
MVRPAEGFAAGVVMGEDAALDALRWNWGDAYDIGCDDGVWWYRRRDGLGGTHTALAPDELRAAIIVDYVRRPVERMHLPDDLAERRERFEAAHPQVRIWHDAGGWHARWPVNVTNTGISHPCELSGLLDRLDALASGEEEAR